MASTNSTSPPAPGDGQAGGHAGDGGAVGGFEEEPGPAQPGPHVGAVDRHRGLDFARGQFRGHLAQQPAELAFEAPHPRLPGVVGGDGPQGIVGHLDLIGPEGGPLQLPGQQVVTGDGQLLVLGVAVEADDLQAVVAAVRGWSRPRWR